MMHEGLEIHALWTVKVLRKGSRRWKFLCKDEENLYTNGGRDWIADQLYKNTSAGTRGAGFLAVSENSGGAAASHTSVAGEITTNGLARADMTDKTHTAGTNVMTLHHAFTASGSFSAVQLGGLLTASSGGILVNEKAFTSTALNSGDILDITITITGPSTGT